MSEVCYSYLQSWIIVFARGLAMLIDGLLGRITPIIGRDFNPIYQTVRLTNLNARSGNGIAESPQIDGWILLLPQMFLQVFIIP